MAEAEILTSEQPKEAYETQWKKVLAYLQKGYPLTSRRAFIELGIQPFPKRICELKRRGYKVDVRTVKFETADGRKGHCKEYRLVDEEAAIAE